MRKLAKNCSWKVIKDPLDVGGFDPGTRFSTDEVLHMLRYHSFTLETVLFNKQGGMFKVKRGVGKKAPFVLINGLSKGEAKGQRLVISPIFT
jgi:hypothetical protein